MDRSQARVTRSTARRLQALAKFYRESSTGVAVHVTPSATGKGIHMRWQYPESASEQETIEIEDLSATIDDEFAHLFNGSLSSIGSRPSLQDLGVEDEFASLFEGSLSSIGSSSSLGRHENAVATMADAIEEDETRTPRATTPVDRFLDRITIHPDVFTEDGMRRRTMREEQRIEETFQAQWQKMLEQRKIALRTIKDWTRKDGGMGDSTTDGTAEDEDCDRHMKIDVDEDHDKANVSGDGIMTDLSTVKGIANGALCRRPLGPCGTVIIDNPYMRGRRTTPPPVYPQEWVTRRLAGRESTESLEGPN